MKFAKFTSQGTLYNGEKEKYLVSYTGCINSRAYLVPSKMKGWLYVVNLNGLGGWEGSSPGLFKNTILVYAPTTGIRLSKKFGLDPWATSLTFHYAHGL
jgi:hypothetical protein